MISVALFWIDGGNSVVGSGGGVVMIEGSSLLPASVVGSDRLRGREDGSWVIYYYQHINLQEKVIITSLYQWGNGLQLVSSSLFGFDAIQHWVGRISLWWLMLTNFTQILVSTDITESAQWLYESSLLVFLLQNSYSIIATVHCSTKVTQTHSNNMLKYSNRKHSFLW